MKHRLLTFFLLLCTVTISCAAGAIRIDSPVYSGTATGTLRHSGTEGFDSVSYINTDPWNINLTGQAFVFEGCSQTASPNGAGQVSYAGIIASGTYPGATFFNGHGTSYIDAVGGSVISNGTTSAANPPQIGFTSIYATGTNRIVLSGSAVSMANGGYMSVSGSGIPWPCNVTAITSGSILTLSAATTGSNNGGIVRLGGNNIMDRLGQAYPHRPAANGGDGGPRAFLFIADGCGANCLNTFESGTSMINELVAVSGSARAMGFTVVVSPTLPTGYRGGGPTWWNPAQESQRQILNSFVRRRGITGAIVVDMCNALSGENLPGPGDTNWLLYDVNGIHPTGSANASLANYLNCAMRDLGQGYQATPETIEHPITVNGAITANGGITISNTNAADFFISQPALVLGNTSSWTFGVNDTDGQQRGIQMKFGYNAAMAGGNIGTLGLVNNPCLYMGGQGQIAVGEAATAAAFNTEDTAIIAKAFNADEAGHFTNTNSSPQIVAQFDQPNSNKTYGIAIGDRSSNNSMILAFSGTAGGGSGANYLSLVPFSQTIGGIDFFMDGTVYMGPFGDPLHNGYKLEVNGTTKVDGNLTLGALMSSGTVTSAIDPVAAITVTGTSSVNGLMLRFVTHAPGSLVPVGLYKDVACTQPATNWGDAVKAWRDDLATRSLVLSNSNSTATLAFVKGIPVIHFPADRYFNSGWYTNSFLAITGGTNYFTVNNSDIWMRARLWSDLNTNGDTSTVLLDGADYGNWDGGSGQDFFQWGSQVLNFGSSLAPRLNYCPVVMRTAHMSILGSGTSTLSADGFPVGSSTASAYTGSPNEIVLAAEQYLGGYPNMIAPAPIDVEALVMGHGITAAQAAAIDASLTPNIGSNLPPLVQSGDSMTQEVLASYNVAPTDDYPSQLQLLNPGSLVINDGHWGDTIANMVTLLPATEALLKWGGTDTLLIGTNEIVTMLTSGSSIAVTANFVETSLASYTATLRTYFATTGAKLFVSTIMPRSTGTGAIYTSGSYQGVLALVNPWIQTSGTFDGVINLNGDPQLGWSGTASGVTNPATQPAFYNQDNSNGFGQTHWTIAGNKAAAQHVALALAGGGKGVLVSGSLVVTSPFITPTSRINVGNICVSGTAPTVYAWPLGTGSAGIFSANSSGSNAVIWNVPTP